MNVSKNPVYQLNVAAFLFITGYALLKLINIFEQGNWDMSAGLCAVIVALALCVMMYIVQTTNVAGTLSANPIIKSTVEIISTLVLITAACIVQIYGMDEFVFDFGKELVLVLTLLFAYIVSRILNQFAFPTLILLIPWPYFMSSLGVETQAMVPMVVFLAISCALAAILYVLRHSKRFKFALISVMVLAVIGFFAFMVFANDFTMAYISSPLKYIEFYNDFFTFTGLEKMYLVACILVAFVASMRMWIGSGSAASIFAFASSALLVVSITCHIGDAFAFMLYPLLAITSAAALGTRPAYWDEINLNDSLDSIQASIIKAQTKTVDDSELDNVLNGIAVAEGYVGRTYNPQAAHSEFDDPSNEDIPIELAMYDSVGKKAEEEKAKKEAEMKAAMQNEEALKKAEEERLATEKMMQEQMAAAQVKANQETEAQLQLAKIALEKAEAEREAERAKAERLALEVAAEKAKAERLAAEAAAEAAAKAMAEKAEAERLAAEEAARAEAERQEAERLAAEEAARAEAERLEAERLAAEEAARAEAERQEAERLAAEEAARAEAERLEAERLAAEEAARAEAERLEAERLAAEEAARAEAERLEAERLAAEEAAKIEEPVFETPAFEMPVFETPEFEEPQYKEELEAPAFAAEEFDVPTFEIPEIETPSFEHETAKEVAEQVEGKLEENVASIADEFEIPSFEMEEEVPVVEKTVEEVAEAVETQVQSEVEPIVIEHAEPIVAEVDEFPSFSNMEIGFGGSTPMFETMASFLAGDTGFASPSFETEEKNDFYGLTFASETKTKEADDFEAPKEKNNASEVVDNVTEDKTNEAVAPIFETADGNVETFGGSFEADMNELGFDPTQIFSTAVVEEEIEEDDNQVENEPTEEITLEEPVSFELGEDLGSDLSFGQMQSLSDFYEGSAPTFSFEEAVVEEPVAEEPVVEEPVAEEPVVEEPVAEEPTIADFVAGENSEYPIEETVEEKVVEPAASSSAKDDDFFDWSKYDDKGAVEETQVEVEEVVPTKTSGDFDEYVWTDDMIKNIEGNSMAAEEQADATEPATAKVDEFEVFDYSKYEEKTEEASLEPVVEEPVVEEFAKPQEYELPEDTSDFAVYESKGTGSIPEEVEEEVAPQYEVFQSSGTFQAEETVEDIQPQYEVFQSSGTFQAEEVEEVIEPTIRTYGEPEEVKMEQPAQTPKQINPLDDFDLDLPDFEPVPIKKN